MFSYFYFRENYEDSEQYKKAYSRDDNESSRMNSTGVDKNSMGNSASGGSGGYVQKLDIIFKIYNFICLNSV